MAKVTYKQLDMTQGNILSSIIAFSIPLLVGSLFQTLYNTVDSAIIGNFVNTEALAAVGACYSPMLILLAVVLGLASGVSVMVSQTFGSGNMDKVKNVIATANGFFLVSVIPVTLCALALIDPLLSIINVQEGARQYANLYLLIIFGGLIGTYGYNLNSGILRGLGDSRSPLLFLLVAFFVNVVLDLLFVLVMQWSVFGVAVATVMAQTVSWVYSIWHIKRHFPHLNYRLFSFHLDRALLGRIISLGLPLAMNHAIFSLGFLFYYRFVYGLGPTFMAGYSIAGKLEGFTWLPISSLGIAAVTFAGQNCGAGNLGLLNKGVKLFLKTAIGINVLTAVITLLFARTLLGLFTPDAEVIDAGFTYLTYLLPFYWIYSIIHILNGIMNGVGDVKTPTYISLLMFWGIRVPLAWYLSTYFSGSVLHAAYPVSWVVGCALTVMYFMTGRWKRGITTKENAGDEKTEPCECDFKPDKAA